MDGKFDFERSLPKSAGKLDNLMDMKGLIPPDIMQGGSDESSAYSLFQRPLGSGQARQPRRDRVKRPIPGFLQPTLKDIQMFLQFIQRLGV
jgi:hypothetical protein